MSSAIFYRKRMKDYNTLDLVAFGCDCYEIGMKRAVESIREQTGIELKVDLNKEQFEAMILDQLEQMREED